MKDCGQGCCGEKCTIRNCGCVQNWILTFCFVALVSACCGFIWHISPAERVITHEYVISERELVPVEPCEAHCKNCHCGICDCLKPEEVKPDTDIKESNHTVPTPVPVENPKAKPKPDCPKQ